MFPIPSTQLLKDTLPRARLQLLEQAGIPLNDIQRAFVLSPKRFKIFRAGRRVGKSYVAAADVLLDFLLPSTRGWVVAPTYELAYKEFSYISSFYEKARKKFKLPPLTVRRENWRGGDMFLKTSWGSEVVGKSADNPVTLQGDELDWLILGEAAEQNPDVWARKMRPCLSSRNGRALFPTTPQKRGKWLYNIEKKALHPDFVDEWDVFTCPAWEAPHFDKSELASAERDLPPEIFAEQYGGVWRFSEGLVYAEWDDSTCIVSRDKVNISPMSPFVVGLDFGAEVTAAVFVARLPDNSYYVFDEHYVGGISTAEHGTKIRSKIDTAGCSYLGTVVDYHALGAQLARDIKGHLINIYKCTNNPEKRRDIVLLLIHQGRLKVSPRCVNLISEISEACYNKAGNITTPDHAIDAMEYAIEFLERRASKLRREPLTRPPIETDVTGYYATRREPSTTRNNTWSKPGLSSLRNSKPLGIMERITAVSRG